MVKKVMGFADKVYKKANKRERNKNNRMPQNNDEDDDGDKR